MDIKKKDYIVKWNQTYFILMIGLKYLSANKDIVKSKINNEVLAFKHYLEHGIKEKELFILKILLNIKQSLFQIIITMKLLILILLKI
jgi:hypothetical protein